MGELYFSTNVSNDVTLCISPLTDERASAAGLDADATGYFLYERSQSGEANDVSVLAQIHSEEAAFRLSRMLGMD
ncbi:hypothetical protein J4G43_026700 [Bradyrhizobium barranii subsp. barranii]|uniref:Uncharacterized protein n=1 Tax=Bradyrhizobium barranii subsp. barranii TaxID=2823807 RepID=A0A939M8X8_9BRAD|nr:hypothetical protein [Bradyrhizobium barranii]UEM08393.1 hypothetical protein J4G43_026700 [Bradyrhizobium barranii subsp. barranii]